MSSEKPQPPQWAGTWARGGGFRRRGQVRLRGCGGWHGGRHGSAAVSLDLRRLGWASHWIESGA